MSAPRIYLAGPDVFRPDSAAVFARLQACCERLGLQGVAPADDGPPDGLAGDALARRIYAGNIARIQAADGVLANLQDFRGLEPDAGTVFEVGYAVALGKPVAAYGVAPGTYADRVATALPCAHDAAGVLREAGNGAMVEGLGQRLNLMLTCSAELVDSAEAGLAWLARRLHARLPLQLRPFAAGDETALLRVFQSAVRQTAARHYTPAQIDAWAPPDIDGEAWAQRVRANRPIVALCGDTVVGFADLQADGLIDQFFVAASHAGQGVGQHLMQAIHDEAARIGLRSLQADVSLAAERFFTRAGFELLQRQAVERHGVTLHNARMRKPLADG